MLPLANPGKTKNPAKITAFIVKKINDDFFNILFRQTKFYQCFFYNFIACIITIFPNNFFFITYIIGRYPENWTLSMFSLYPE